MSTLYVLVTIDPNGRVTDAKVDGKNYEQLDPSPGLAAARQWRFKPQQFNGLPVRAVGSIAIEYQRPETPPDYSVPFPEGDPADIEITLERGACFGLCPAYQVSIFGNGLVRFTTDKNGFAGTAAAVHLAYNGNNVMLPGTHEARVDPAAVASLLARFRAAGFFGLKSSYAASITDSSAQIVTLRVGKASKRVTDYVGRAVGMPAAVIDLERGIDTLAGTARWVSGNLDTIAMLDAQHFDYRSQQAADLANAAAVHAMLSDETEGPTAMINTMISRGIALDRIVTRGTSHNGEILGAVLVSFAATTGNETLLNDLAARGYVQRTPVAQLSSALASGVGCNPTIARTLISAGADPRGTSRDGTALSALRGVASACATSSNAQLIDMARTLIALGAPIDGRDDIGWTPLMGCDSPALARLLLQHGADPNARDNDGTTPLLATDDDRVALILLAAGANPRARDENGSVRQQAIKQNMPGTLVWLDRHNIRQ